MLRERRRETSGDPQKAKRKRRHRHTRVTMMSHEPALQQVSQPQSKNKRKGLPVEILSCSSGPPGLDSGPPPTTQRAPSLAVPFFSLEAPLQISSRITALWAMAHLPPAQSSALLLLLLPPPRKTTTHARTQRTGIGKPPQTPAGAGAGAGATPGLGQWDQSRALVLLREVRPPASPAASFSFPLPPLQPLSLS